MYANRSLLKRGTQTENQTQREICLHTDASIWEIQLRNVAFFKIKIMGILGIRCKKNSVVLMQEVFSQES